MSGIYLHIPFCHQACHYCDFHFSTNLGSTEKLIKMMAKELMLRKHEISSPIKTVYFGGGTPSILETEQLDTLFESLSSNYSLSEVEEITIEANPEDINREKVEVWKNLGINRVSLGIQSFNDDVLKKFNRNHSKDDSLKAIEVLFNSGIENISIDLIYGFDNYLKNWKNDLEQAFNLPIKHLSCYQLTIEEKTVFGKWHKKGLIQSIDEEIAFEQLKVLEEKIEEKGWVWYEISNFSEEKFNSKHNSSYWKNLPYLGIGPSSHSFDGINKRVKNISNNYKYIDSLTQEILAIEETEHLNESQINIEKIMTGLRTKWGIDISQLKNRKIIDSILGNEAIKQYIYANLVKFENNIISLTKEGFYVADKIILDIISEFD
ncbi:MAG: radical SAM family heme chaperone HemW [Cytophagales bacterium]